MLIREFYVPTKLISEANAREHWAIKNKRKKAQHFAVNAAWIAAGLNGKAFFWPLTITLTRIGPRKLDSDNLAGSFKAAQDQVARCLAVDDGDEARVRWVYAQTKGKPKEYGLLVRLECDEPRDDQ